MKVLMWGMGKLAKIYLSLYHVEFSQIITIEAIVDNDEKKIGTKYEGYQVISPNKLHLYQYDYIVIMTLYFEVIKKQIVRENLSFNTDSIISIGEYISLAINLKKLPYKKIVFMGDREAYRDIEFRIKHTFFHVEYKNASTTIADGVDYVFLCPKRLINNDDELEFEKECRRNIIGKEVTIKSYKEWIWFIRYDKRILGGGKNKDNVFYIIPVSDAIRGWAHLLIRFVSCVDYALHNNMIPVIDMQNVRNQYLEDSLVGKHNAWEDFFLPVSKFSLEEAYNSKNIILAGIDPIIREGVKYSLLKYVPILEDYICEKKKEFLRNRTGKILGIVYRGTDYNIAANHIKPYSEKDFIKRITDCIKISEYDNIFLATEAEESVDIFKSYFGNKLFCTDQKRFSSKEKELLCRVKFKRANDSYLRGQEYLLVLEMLMECNVVIGQDTGTMKFLQCFNDSKYKKIYII